MRVLALRLTYNRTLSVSRAVNVSGVIGDPVVILEDINCTRAMPIDPSGVTGLRESEIVQTLTEVFWVFCDGTPDIREGDTITLDGADYVVRVAQERESPGVLSVGDYTRLTVERLRM